MPTDETPDTAEEAISALRAAMKTMREIHESRLEVANMMMELDSADPAILQRRVQHAEAFDAALLSTVKATWQAIGVIVQGVDDIAARVQKLEGDDGDPFNLGLPTSFDPN
jgi:hypothetical protein